MEMIRKLWNDESGQGLVEYGLLVGFVAVMVIVLAALFREGVSEVFSNLNSFLTTEGDPADQLP